MPRITSRSWTPDQIARLKELAAIGASPARIAGALNRSMAATRSMANKLDIKVRGIQQIKAAIREAEREKSKW